MYAELGGNEGDPLPHYAFLSSEGKMLAEGEYSPDWSDVATFLECLRLAAPKISGRDLDAIKAALGNGQNSPP